MRRLQKFLLVLVFHHGKILSYHVMLCRLLHLLLKQMIHIIQIGLRNKFHYSVLCRAYSKPFHDWISCCKRISWINWLLTWELTTHIISSLISYVLVIRTFQFIFGKSFNSCIIYIPYHRFAFSLTRLHRISLIRLRVITSKPRRHL